MVRFIDDCRAALVLEDDVEYFTYDNFISGPFLSLHEEVADEPSSK
jgi:hypothetical protein